MRRFALGALCAASLSPTAALAECGNVSITEMSFSSAIITTAVAKFLMEQGYGCTVTTAQLDTIPAITSLAENNEPDIVTELWVNSAGDAYAKLKAEGRVKELSNVLDPGGVEGWWIPTYLAEAHPELTTVQGILDNPELVDNRFHNCPAGWVCRIINANNARAWKFDTHGIEVHDHGSGETLAASLAAAYEAREPWFGYYWEPTEIMGKYAMTPVDFGALDRPAHDANVDPDVVDPRPSAYPPSLVLTVATSDFVAREPEVADMIGKLHFDTDAMSTLLAWKDENNANAEEAAVHFLQTNTDEWSGWLNDAARARLAKILK